ncbi:cytochrome C assembly family protein [Paludisphaera mucosa]|uniref:Cytochrome c biogenesis protein CcsA n=1 Tax=Paludisphaera mucosa TaxID=3030827 RepID=A0ABT6FIT9_9BACT|nr:cytochrome c biogenesis protein CcsA [Paludisphaera mucosa]MDG3007501.1 cytochrome c biogenesis protein CcsA [Paludisphaera mucosa]
MDRLKILCFAGTYGLALAVELARVFVRGGGAFRWHLGVGLTFLGWCVQTIYLANIAWKDQTLLPVTSAFESVMVLSWVVALIGLYLMIQWPRNVAVGFFTLPLVLGLILGAAWFVPRSEGREWEGATAFWGTIHGVFLLAGAVCASLAFAAGLMYLAQMRRLKSKPAHRFGFSLPSLEQSERVNRGAVVAAFPLLTAGLLIGALLSAVELRKGGVEASSGVPWYDPKVLSAAGMWLVFAVLLHARFRPSMRGRTVMMLTIAAFAFLVFTWVGVEALRLPTAHGAPRTAGRLP